MKINDNDRLALISMLKKADDLKCKKCDSLTFLEGRKVKRLSKLITGESEDAIFPIPTFVCSSCGQELELEPAEKEKSPIIQ